MLTPSAARPARAGEVVAVFNFAQRDDDPKHAWLSKGLADLLINQLSDLPELTVVSRDRMQSLVSEYERLVSRPVQVGKPAALRPLGAGLEAKRIVFGTYGVRGTKVVLTAQVTGVENEQVLFESQVEGSYAKVLELERELARRVRAYFLGRPVRQVPLKDVPHWTTTLGAAEHLYAGVNLFDQSEYAQGWLRFRQAARADRAYADAVYWQGRMLYYLLLYDNAHPLLEAFMRRWPGHPRAGDAGLELIDSWRQSIADPQVLHDRLVALHGRVRPEIIVPYNVPPYRKKTELRTYLGASIVQALLGMGRIDEAVDVALKVQEARKHHRRDFDWTDYTEMVRQVAIERYFATDKPVLDGMFPPPHDKCDMVRPEKSFRVVKPNKFCRSVDYYPVGDKLWPCPPEAIGAAGPFVAPTGHEFSRVRMSFKWTHRDGSEPFQVQASARLWADKLFDPISAGRTDQEPRPVELVLPHRCRFVGIHVMNRALTSDLVDKPTVDTLDEWRADFEFRPLPPDHSQIRVHLVNLPDAIIKLDGRPVLATDGVIRGVAPGQHTVTAEPVMTWYSGRRMNIYGPAEQKVVVPERGAVDCHLAFPLTPEREAAGWQLPRPLPDEYPWARLPPDINQPEGAATMVRAVAGPLAGHLVVVWPYRGDLWLSYSQDDGGTWVPPQHLPTPVNSAHQELEPRLIQDEQGRFCLALISDRNLERALYPYVCTSRDLVRWTAPARVADIVADKLRFFQGQGGRYLLLLPPLEEAVREHHGYYAFSGKVAEWQPTKALEAFDRKYARKEFRMLGSTDARRWEVLDTDLGVAKLLEADIVQTTDGVFHALLAHLTEETPESESCTLSHRTSADGLHWSPLELVFTRPHTCKNVQLVTDGRRVFAMICYDNNHPHFLRIGMHDSCGWRGFATTRGVFYHDPPGFGNRMHWVWRGHTFLHSEDYQPNEGRLFYTSRQDSEDDEWMLQYMKARQKDKASAQ